MTECKAKVDRCHSLPVSRQCEVLVISRASAYRAPSGVSNPDIDLMRKLDELHLKHPFKGSRRPRDDLWAVHGLHGLQVNRKRVQRLMKIMGIRALYPGARTTRPNKQHKVYPYLLRDLDEWIRRRLRSYVWKQWGRKGYRMLRRLGVDRWFAWNTSKSAHGPWRLSVSPALYRALPNSYFKNLGLPELAAR